MTDHTGRPQNDATSEWFVLPTDATVQDKIKRMQLLNILCKLSLS